MARSVVTLPVPARAFLSSHRGRRLRENLLAYVYLLPATLILVLFHFYPLLRAFWISLHRWGLRPGPWLGLKNYTDAMQDQAFWDSFKVTVFYVLGTVPFQLILSLFIAYLLYQNLRGKEIYRIIFFLPYITTTVASAAIWTRMYNPSGGLFNGALQLLGLPSQRWMLEPKGIFRIVGDYVGISVPNWAEGPSLALVGIMFFVIWFWVGYDTTIFLAGLGNIPGELYEAARMDGAGRWQLFRFITLPLLSPTTFFLSLVAVIGSFQAFTHVYVMTWASTGDIGGPLGTTTTVTMFIFREFWDKQRYGYASAAAFILFIVILGLTLAQNRAARNRVFYG